MTINGLVFLDPKFVTDLIKPLVYHLLKEEIKSKIARFLKRIEKVDQMKIAPFKIPYRTLWLSGSLGAQICELNGNNLPLRYLWHKRCCSVSRIVIII